jgi:tRNA G18 (ribose-2'-O)-methylase SpoU
VEALTSVLAQETALVVGLDHVSDPDNVGSIFRNAAAFGADAVVLGPGCCDPLYRKAIRTSLGQVLRVPWAISEDLSHAWSDLKGAGLELVVVETGAKSVELSRHRFSPKTALVFGAEGVGVSEATLAQQDHQVRIPMAEGVASINVAAASAVVLHEVRRSHSTM